MNNKKDEALLKALGVLAEAANYTSSESWSPSMTRDCVRVINHIKEALAEKTAQQPVADEPMWIVNDLGELGVKVNGRFFFLYKGESIEYGKSDQGNTALHGDGTPMKYRIVGKREFGETCLPLRWIAQGYREDRYTEELQYIPGLSFGEPEDVEWKSLPAAHDIAGEKKT